MFSYSVTNKVKMTQNIPEQQKNQKQLRKITTFFTKHPSSLHGLNLKIKIVTLTFFK